MGMVRFVIPDKQHYMLKQMALDKKIPMAKNMINILVGVADAYEKKVTQDQLAALNAQQRSERR